MIVFELDLGGPFGGSVTENVMPANEPPVRQYADTCPPLTPDDLCALLKVMSAPTIAAPFYTTLDDAARVTGFNVDRWVMTVEDGFIGFAQLGRERPEPTAMIACLPLPRSEKPGWFDGALAEAGMGSTCDFRIVYREEMLMPADEGDVWPFGRPQA